MKINISNYTYIVLLFSFLSGYFEYMYLFLLIIFVHESGHYFFSKIIRFKYASITIYPFGGITEYKEDLNINTNKELFVLIGGITFELIFYYLIFVLYKYNYVTNHVFNIFRRINMLLISFNFMPIIPLDGGKLISIILDKIFNYRLSNIICIIISIIFSIAFVIYNHSLFGILLFLFLVKNIIIEIYNLKYKYNKFILERYLNKYSFNHIKKVNNISKFKRDYTHIIDNEFESAYLHKLFDTNK